MSSSGTTRPALTTQLVRFVVSGGISAVVDFGLLVALMAVGLDPVPAKSVSFIAGTTTAYLINRRWTFQAQASAGRFLAVVALYAVTFALQVGLFSLCYPLLLGWTGQVILAQAGAFVIAQGTATAVNFVVQRGLIFR